jgi:hypothetical protein
LLAFQRVLGRARQARRGRRIRIAVTAAQPVRSLKIQLRDARGRVVARGALSRLGRSGRVFLKFRRAARAGRYTIVATARVGARTQRVTQAVAVRR